MTLDRGGIRCPEFLAFAFLDVEIHIIAFHRGVDRPS